MFDDRLKRFILAEKPPWCKAVDTAIMTYFMTIADEKGQSSPTQPEISAVVGGGDKNLFGLRKSLERLIENKWLWRDKKAVGQRNLYEVHFTNLPPERRPNVETTSNEEPVL